MDLKQTVNLPKTDFPMKADLAQREPLMLARWNAEGLYAQIRTARAGRPRYVLHDGPPYANGNIHLGHAFNKLLKDFIIKSKTMAGYDSPYVPGWDCHGLPIEIKVDAQLGSKKAQMTTAQIRQECRKYAAKFVDLQSKDFQRLGILGRWEKPYLTMDPEYQGAIAQAFVDFLDQGYVYKGLKPVNWCISCRTSLAEAEIEYATHTSPSIYVRFRLESEGFNIHPALDDREIYGVIWTTTPWTIPANLAISFHPKFEYSAVEVEGAVYIIASELLPAVSVALGWEATKVLARFPGSKLDRVLFRHPFVERDSLGLLGDHVTLEAGTGAVHTAPGHGMDDYVIAKQYDIEPYNPVDPAGRLFAAPGAAGELPAVLLGKKVWEANAIVIHLLKESGALLLAKDFEHSYPHCWRCHNPTIFRATEQWFIGMERTGPYEGTLRQRTLEAIKGIKWMPSWGEERMSNMIASRPDWNISRQRVWGVPIPVFYCESCLEAVTEKRLLDPIVDRFRRETADVWYSSTAQELLPAGYQCAKCGGAEFRKETDILDVWFDSGSSHLAVLTAENGLGWPAECYLEGGDQYRGWFHSSLLVGMGLQNGSPYRECATNGWTLDGEGKAMSKSVGNVVEPEKIIKQFGADVLRLWVASVAFNEDVRISDVILSRLTEAYRKLRNTFRYALSNLDGFDPAAHMVPLDEMRELDQWILLRTDDLVERCRHSYDNFEFHRVYQAIYNFASVDLSSTYFDVLKDRLYTALPHSPERRSGQSALYLMTHALLRLCAPLLAFTSEEAWGYLAKREGDAASVHLAPLPEPGTLAAGLSPAQRERLNNWSQLLAIRDEVLKSLETKRQEKFIGKSLEAKLSIRADTGQFALLNEYAAELPEWFIVSQVELARHAGPLSVEVLKADGTKCERCWKFKPDTGSNADYPTVCASCAAAVTELGG